MLFYTLFKKYVTNFLNYKIALFVIRYLLFVKLLLIKFVSFFFFL